MPVATENKVICVRKSLTLRCYIYEQRPGLFVAECIDLDLMVKDRHQERAKRELRDAIIGHLQVALELGQDAVLVPRPSPLSHRLHYSWLQFLSLVRPSNKPRVFNINPPASVSCCA